MRWQVNCKEYRSYIRTLEVEYNQLLIIRKLFNHYINGFCFNFLVAGPSSQCRLFVNILFHWLFLKHKLYLTLLNINSERKNTSTETPVMERARKLSQVESVQENEFVSIFNWNVNKNLAFYWSLFWWFVNHIYIHPLPLGKWFLK